MIFSCGDSCSLCVIIVLRRQLRYDHFEAVGSLNVRGALFDHLRCSCMLKQTACLPLFIMWYDGIVRALFIEQARVLLPHSVRAIVGGNCIVLVASRLYTITAYTGCPSLHHKASILTAFWVIVMTST